jgi:hypothetical protein
MLYADVLAKTGEAAKSGPLGFAVILVLCVVCYFLFKSMSKHLRRVREDFPRPDAEPEQQPPATQPPASAHTPAPGPPRAATENPPRSDQRYPE